MVRAFPLVAAILLAACAATGRQSPTPVAGLGSLSFPVTTRSVDARRAFERGYLRAADIAEEVFRRHPDHPGASHYLIHAVDDPAHAARGLDAARALARYSPDAGHAQHMTSHIFLALGMWDDVVTANENSLGAFGELAAAHGHHPSACGHGQTWLSYAYLQLGRVDDARAMVHACARQAQADPSRVAADDIDPDNTLIGSAAFMWSRYIIDAEAWSGEDIAWNPGFGGAVTAPAAIYDFTAGFAAARRADLAAARDWLGRFETVRSGLRARAGGAVTDPGLVEYLTGLDVLELELEGLLLLGARDERGIATLRRATVLEGTAWRMPSVRRPSTSRRTSCSARNWHASSDRVRLRRSSGPRSNARPGGPQASAAWLGR